MQSLNVKKIELIFKPRKLNIDRPQPPNGLFQKKSKEGGGCPFRNSRVEKTSFHHWKFCKIMWDSLEIQRLKVKKQDPWKFQFFLGEASILKLPCLLCQTDINSQNPPTQSLTAIVAY